MISLYLSGKSVCRMTLPVISFFQTARVYDDFWVLKAWTKVFICDRMQGVNIRRVSIISICFYSVYTKYFYLESKISSKGHALIIKSILIRMGIPLPQAPSRSLRTIWRGWPSIWPRTIWRISWPCPNQCPQRTTSKTWPSAFMRRVWETKNLLNMERAFVTDFLMLKCKDQSSEMWYLNLFRKISKVKGTVY